MPLVLVRNTVIVRISTVEAIILIGIAYSVTVGVRCWTVRANA